MDVSPMLISLKLGFFVSLLCILGGLILNYRLLNTKNWQYWSFFWRWPLVFPPTVLGFYWLLLFGKEGTIPFLRSLGWVFSFEGICAASVLAIFPHTMNILEGTLGSNNIHQIESAHCLGRSKIYVYLHIYLRGNASIYLSAMIQAFLLALGEFGLIWIVGGNIPQETRTASVYIVELMQKMEWKQTHLISMYLLLPCIVLSMLSIILMNKRT